MSVHREPWGFATLEEADKRIEELDQEGWRLISISQPSWAGGAQWAYFERPRVVARRDA